MLNVEGPIGVLITPSVKVKVKLSLPAVPEVSLYLTLEAAISAWVNVVVELHPPGVSLHRFKHVLALLICKEPFAGAAPLLNVIFAVVLSTSVTCSMAFVIKEQVDLVTVTPVFFARTGGSLTAVIVIVTVALDNESAVPSFTLNVKVSVTLLCDGGSYADASYLKAFVPGMMEAVP